MAIADGVEHKYELGQRVEVFQPVGATWAEAEVTALRPYRGMPGYDVSYPSATEMWHCHGRWTHEGAMRVPKAKAKQ